MDIGLIAPLVRAGRAVLYPIYKGSYERYVPPEQRSGRAASRDQMIMRSRDAQRSVDYLQSRDDIRLDEVAYCGFSKGGSEGLIYMALEERFRTAILLNGGLSMAPADSRLPERDAFNFAPRVKAPVLMLNGRNDQVFPLEQSQVPMLQLLGTPAADKKHGVYDRGHARGLLSNEEIAEILTWLDKYLGPVN